MELANGQAQTSRQLQERLQETEGSRDSLIVALTLKRAARVEAECRAAEREAADSTQIAMHASFAFEQNESLEVRGLQTCMQGWLPVWPTTRQAISDGQLCETCCLQNPRR